MPERDYSAVPLQKKLGVGPEMRVAMVSVPGDALATLGPLPPGTVTTARASTASDLILWWPADAADLARRIGRLARLTKRAGLWVLWPKRASGLETDLTDSVIRHAGLATGLVDNKIAAFDATWSALRFVPRLRQGDPRSPPAQ